MPTPLDDQEAWAAMFGRLAPPKPAKRSAPPGARESRCARPRGSAAQPRVDVAIARLRGCLAGTQKGALLTAVDPTDLGVVLTALERLRPPPRPAPRPVREENLVALHMAINPRSKVEMPAADCPDDNTSMRCLETRRPGPGMVRRRWECPRCKKRFTSYTHEKE